MDTAIRTGMRRSDRHMGDDVIRLRMLEHDAEHPPKTSFMIVQKCARVHVAITIYET